MTPKDPFAETSIGDFERPIVPAPKAQPKAPPKAEGPAPAALDAAEQKIVEEVAETEKVLSPLEAYEAKLKKAGLTVDTARAIFDDLLQKGYWTEEVQFSARTKVRFRSRQYADTERFQEHVEQVRPQYESHYNELLFKYSLAASLEQFGATRFEFPKTSDSAEQIEKLFQRRLEFVMRLPDAMVRLLYAKLGRFDEKVRAVMEEGATENF